MIHNKFIFDFNYTKSLKAGSATCQSPSNIALVKYWGKSDPQIPKNASISFTLSNCHSTTILQYSPKKVASDTYDFKVFLDGKEKVDFAPKIQKFFERIEVYVPFIKDLSFEIHTRNSFPHSSGIASSASGMSALSICLMCIQKDLNTHISHKEFKEKASFLARLGSGSAARSIQGPLVVWGEHPHIFGSNDLTGIKYPGAIHEVFKSFNDTILLVDQGTKQVSSTVGHKLMLGHPYSEARFEQAQDNMSRMIPILKNGDLSAFIQIVEKEALSLHAMMMTSDPYFLLMKPNTLEIIERIWAFRKASQTHVCFTLDAGANVHVLFPDKDKDKVTRFIKEELIEFCENQQYIEDHVGQGALVL